MQITFRSPADIAKHVDTLVIALFADTPIAQALGRHRQVDLKTIADAAREQGFVGNFKQQLICRVAQPGGPTYVVLLGVGKLIDGSAANWLRVGGQAVRCAMQLGAKKVGLVGAFEKAPLDCQTRVTLLTRGALLGAYRFDAFRAPSAATVRKLDLILGVAATPALKEACTRGQTMAEAQALARDLVNTPPNVLYPASFAELAQKRGKRAGLKVSVLKETELKKRKMNLLLAVGEASHRPPRLVHLVCPARRGAPKTPPVCLVGKGITFDSGGLCLKSADSMVTMKMDMGGAAAVLAALCAAKSLNLPFAVHGVLALAENMPAGNALRTGDVLTSAQGLTVEVNNTDAEGRLVLADAIDYARKQIKPDLLVDLATLTGACMVALGPHTVGLFSNRDAVADTLLEAAHGAGEDMWRLPLTPSLRDQLKSDVADMRNTGDRLGGAITAALFLQEFVGETAWAHLDIAGPAFTGEDQGHISKGGTGVGAATLIELLARRAQRIGQ